VRRKRDKRPAVPLKYRQYRPHDWPEGGWGQWVREREAWARAQPAIVITGADAYGTPWRCVITPLGDKTDLIRARREARMIAFADVSQPD
jgi:hypothetical protein